MRGATYIVEIMVNLCRYLCVIQIQQWQHQLHLQLQDPPKYRACLDLCAINKVMVIESYPIPTFNSII